MLKSSIRFSWAMKSIANSYAYWRVLETNNHYVHANKGLKELSFGGFKNACRLDLFGTTKACNNIFPQRDTICHLQVHCGASFKNISENKQARTADGSKPFKTIHSGPFMNALTRKVRPATGMIHMIPIDSRHSFRDQPRRGNGSWPAKLHWKMRISQR